MKAFVIAEKPSVAKDIAAALGGCKRLNGGFFESDTVVIGAAHGHLVKMQVPASVPQAWSLSELPMLPSSFELVANSDDDEESLSSLARIMKRRDVASVVNACDAGREGELIFRNLYRFIAEHHGALKPARRMWLQSMTPDAIRDAWANAVDASKYDGLADAALARSEADWIVGINASRGLSEFARLKSGTRAKFTAGRVQTPTLALVVDRELSIRNFREQAFFRLRASFAAERGSYDSYWSGDASSGAVTAVATPDGDRENEGALPTGAFARVEDVEAIIERCKGKFADSCVDQGGEERASAPKLFDLTSLQREANRLFGYTAATTLEIAQTLYQAHKMITYPRTDSSFLPSDYVAHVKAVLGLLNGPYSAFAVQALESDYVHPSANIFDDKKISDHFAIIPTGVIADTCTREEAVVYDLICKRFVSAFFPAAVYRRNRRTTVIGQDVFAVTGRVLLSPGWKVVYGTDEADVEAASLPALKAAELPECVSAIVDQGRTRPPQRYNDASLLGAMEAAGRLVPDEEARDAMKEKGLGTPATRASIIEKLLDVTSGFMTREGKSLVPTEKAMNLIKFLRSSGIDELGSAALTGEWELRLRSIEKGSLTRLEYMRGISSFAHSVIEKIRAVAPAIAKGDTPLAACCSCCKGVVVASERQFKCSGCGFVMWRVLSGRSVSVGEAELLLSGQTVPAVSGFVSKTGRVFSAGMRLAEGGRVDLVFA